MLNVLIPAFNPSSFIYSISYVKSLYPNSLTSFYVREPLFISSREKSIYRYVKTILSEYKSLKIESVSNCSHTYFDLVIVTDASHPHSLDFVLKYSSLLASSSRTIVIGDIFGISPPTYTVHSFIARLVNNYRLNMVSPHISNSFLLSLKLSDQIKIINEYRYLVQILSSHVDLEPFKDFLMNFDKIHIDIMPALLDLSSLKSRINQVIRQKSSETSRLCYIFLPHPKDRDLLDEINLSNFTGSDSIKVYTGIEASEVLVASLSNLTNCKITMSFASTAILPVYLSSDICECKFIPLVPRFKLSSYNIPFIFRLVQFFAVIQRAAIKNLHTLITFRRFIRYFSFRTLLN